VAGPAQNVRSLHLKTCSNEYPHPHGHRRSPSPTTSLSPTLVNVHNTERPLRKLTIPSGASNILNSESSIHPTNPFTPSQAIRSSRLGLVQGRRRAKSFRSHSPLVFSLYPASSPICKNSTASVSSQSKSDSSATGGPPDTASSSSGRPHDESRPPSPKPVTVPKPRNS
jgi:hypothetical protein